MQEGLFAAERKQARPLIPTQIGGHHLAQRRGDTRAHLTVLKRRFPAIPVLIYPVAVQGETAKTEIAAASASANRQQLTDVIILARGGGSLEDLWAFNEEIVARAIAASTIPVISAIGHEVDVTIADFVADLRAATPSAAAEHAVPHQDEWLNAFTAVERALQQHIRQRLSREQQRLNWLNKALQQQHPGQKLQRNAQRLDELEQRINQAMQHKLRDVKQLLAIGDHRLKQWLPSERIARHRQQVHYVRQRLQTAMRVKLAELHNRQAAVSLTLNAVSPLATLERGYAIVQRREDNKIVKSVSQLRVDDLFCIRVAKGQVISQVREISD